MTRSRHPRRVLRLTSCRVSSGSSTSSGTSRPSLCGDKPTDDRDLLTAFEADLDDPVPAVRFQAAKGLWQWYYWQVDRGEERTGILEALATRLNTEADP